MKRIIVSGCGTGIGKTIVSAIVLKSINGAYWKPVECGESDSEIIKMLLPETLIYAPTYRFKASVSPHHAARLEKCSINATNFNVPVTKKPLVIEMVGGIFVPLNLELLTIDLFNTWQASWIVVSHNYLGSINHTLLTIEALQKRNCHIAGIIFNGHSNPDSEKAILQFSKISCLGRIKQHKQITTNLINKYAKEWKQNINTLLK